MEPIIDKLENKPKAASGGTYKLAPRFEHLAMLVTVLKGGRRVNLAGNTVKVPREPTPEDPRTEIVVQGATQADLAEYFAGGTQKLVIKV